MAADARVVRPIRRGVPGMAALAMGAGAAGLAPFAQGPSVALGAGAVAAAGLELLEVHRPAFRQAVAGLVLGAGGALAAVGTLAARKMNLAGLGHNFFNLDTLEGAAPQFLRGALNTIELAGLSELLGIALGLFLALMAISKHPAVRLPAVAYIDVFRGTPLLVQLLFIYLALPFVGITLDVFSSGIVGLSLNSAAYVAEIFRAGIQSIERGQMEAARSLGMPYRTAMRYVVVPQAVRRVIPPLMNEFIALLKDSSLVSVLGATVLSRELLRVARDLYSQFANATPFVAASAAYLLLTVPLTRLVNRLDRRLRAPA